MGCGSPTNYTPAKGQGGRHTCCGYPLPIPKMGSEDMAFISLAFKLYILFMFIPLYVFYNKKQFPTKT